MPEALSGNLAQLPLLEILKLLSSEGQTGRLSLSNGASKGEIFLREGNVVHAASGEHISEEAVYSLMGWLQGGFRFVPDVGAPEESVTTPTEQVLLEGARRVQQWGEIKKVIPSTDVVFKLSPVGASGTVNLEAYEWQVVARVNAARTVAQIAQDLGEDEFRVAKVLYRLVSAGLLEVGEKPEAPLRPTINGGFFRRLDGEFTEVMGPLGPVIIDDEIAALGETRESFPRDKVAQLIERVSAEIQDAEKRSRFQGIMLEAIRNL
ncbi:MAG: hypothetical protein CEE40_01860 [Chloroflexi bacterium B3_Chlor]|nr:MAG: hypothetical protein CEE40_01860 [Chloroflexi bacterium B3_Chlor]